ncbi:WW domain-binding protein 2-like [Arapaima gigas]
MTLNRNHSHTGGVLISNGESVLKECKNVELSFSDVTSRTELLKGTRKGTVYLTPYRMVFVSSNTKDSLGSMMFPYYLMKGCSIEQPVFSANYIKGTISAEPGGGWEGQATFKLAFPSGGAIELGENLFKLASNASRGQPVHSGASSFGYPSPGAMNSYGPVPAPYSYPCGQPPQSNGFFQVPPQALSTMGYPCPTAPAGPAVYPSAPTAPVYMPPPPPYPGPPQGWAAPPPGPADAAGSAAYYNPNNPHNVFMPMEQPPPYAPYAPYADKKNN